MEADGDTPRASRPHQLGQVLPRKVDAAEAHGLVLQHQDDLQPGNETPPTTTAQGPIRLLRRPQALSGCTTRHMSEGTRSAGVGERARRMRTAVPWVHRGSQEQEALGAAGPHLFPGELRGAVVIGIELRGLGQLRRQALRQCPHTHTHTQRGGGNAHKGRGD